MNILLKVKAFYFTTSISTCHGGKLGGKCGKFDAFSRHLSLFCGKFVKASAFTCGKLYFLNNYYHDDLPMNIQ
jgi:hypothetical protein